jgi:hypothetical protein
MMKYLYSIILITSGVLADTATNPNNVYIEQLGNANAISINQVGGSNNVGGITGSLSVDSQTHISTILPAIPSSSNYATVNGSSNTISISQQGSDNWMQYYINGSDNNFFSSSTGNGNRSRLSFDANSANLRNTISAAITGSNNYTIQSISGNDINSSATISGNNNQITEDLHSSKGVVNTTITGSNNILFSAQSDTAGAFGHSLSNFIVGDYNSITTQQQGINDTSIDIRTTGDHNTISVNSSSSAIINPLFAISR